MLLDIESVKEIFLDVLNRSYIAAYAPVDVDFTKGEDFQFSMNYKDKVSLRLTHTTSEIFTSSFSLEDRNVTDRIGLENAIEYGLQNDGESDSYSANYANEIYFALRTFEKYGITVEHLIDSGKFEMTDVIRYHTHMKLPMPIRD